jgi:ribosome biogenesis GTPase / thiamine phosphate phosphatase
MQNFTEEIQKGLVVSYFGNSVAVETSEGKVFQCYLRRNQELPVVGDHVLWQFNTEDTGIITQIEPRRSILARGDGRKQHMKIIAANIDTLVIVMAPEPIFSEYLIDRYLLAAELLNLKSLIVLNKSDLLTKETTKIMQEKLDIYDDIGYKTVLSSAVTTGGLQLLDQALAGLSGVLVGPSGVGKSSIIAALSQEEIRVGDVSSRGAGKHTTTATRLYHLVNGGNLIDSPGVREFNLWAVNKKEVLQGFKEFRNFQGCKFSDCQHLAEPKCAVQTAVQEGKIGAERYASYQKFMKDAL